MSKFYSHIYGYLKKGFIIDKWVYLYVVFYMNPSLLLAIEDKDRYDDEFGSKVLDFILKKFQKSPDSKAEMILDTQYLYLDSVISIYAALWEDKEIQSFLYDHGVNKSPNLTIKTLGDYLEEIKETDYPIIDRDKELYLLMQILSKDKKKNPVLIGEAGVGKTALIQKLVQKINHGDAPANLLKSKVYAATLNQLKSMGISGLESLAMFTKKLTGYDTILFIDEIHKLAEDKSFADTLKPFLANPPFPVIGATTSEEYKKIEKDKALERRFEQIYISEPDKETLYKILHGVRGYFEKKHDVLYSDDILLELMEISTNYMTSRNQPDKAIDLMDQVGAALKLSRLYHPYTLYADAIDIEKTHSKMDINEVLGLSGANEKLKKYVLDKFNAFIKSKVDLTPEYKAYENYIGTKESLDLSDKVAPQAYLNLYVDYLNARGKMNDNKFITYNVTKNVLHEVASITTDIPIGTINADEKQKLVTMADKLKTQVIGQDNAIDSLVRSIKRYRSGIRKMHRPIGNFLFMGPTGVGKTYTAKMLAKEMYGDESAMIRFDMSEYMQPHNVSKFIGSPPGYVGYDRGGQLTEKVKRRPYSILLFDEVEKAHPQVFNIFLQIFDDGRLTDSYGDTIDFTNTIIIMTSNIGSKYIAENIKRDMSDQDIANQVNSLLKNVFPPELINRFDDKIVFHTLNDEHIIRIIKMQLDELAEALYENKGITMEYDKSVIEKVYMDAYKPNIEYGARPIAREIEQKIEATIANEIFEKDFLYVYISAGINGYKLKTK